MILQSLLTKAELEIVRPRQTTLSEMWHQDYVKSASNWGEKFPQLAEAIADDKRWRHHFLYYYSQAAMYVHRIMSYNEGFPMVLYRMTSYYSGLFDSTRNEQVYYILFQDPYYQAWILILFKQEQRIYGRIVETYQVSHGEDVTMFLSDEKPTCCQCHATVPTHQTDDEGWLKVEEDWYCYDCREKQDDWLECDGCGNTYPAVMLKETEIEEDYGHIYTNWYCPICLGEE